MVQASLDVFTSTVQDPSRCGGEAAVEGNPQVPLLRNRNAAYVFNVKRLHLAFSDP